MIISYKVKSDRPDPSLAVFEETLSFRDGFRSVKIPPSVGEGDLTALHFADDFHVNFQFYQLDVPLEVIKEHSFEPTDLAYIVFYQLQLPEKAWLRGEEVVYDQEGVNIYTQSIDATLRFPAGTRRSVVCLRISRRRLQEMMGCQDKDYLGKLLQPSNSFFINEQLTTDMRDVLGELQVPPAARSLQQLFYHTRVLQLIYLLMERLNKRAFLPNKNSDPLHIARIFNARAMLVSDLSSPPTIASLARHVLLSESLLKQSFREMFGVSIYQYFQRMRLDRARRLLAENNRTVKEVAYELGFTNTGHFSRLFERTFHVKPKKFQLDRPELPDPTLFLSS
ncbi:MAG: helix-turn-helix transcriptional regulator [Chitinophagaceae bacterium]|nr:helix-turn-helix transcriptional regulator [Chitinophagaceae bacterium]